MELLLDSAADILRFFDTIGEFLLSVTLFYVSIIYAACIPLMSLLPAKFVVLGCDLMLSFRDSVDPRKLLRYDILLYTVLFWFFILACVSAYEHMCSPTPQQKACLAFNRRFPPKKLQRRLSLS